jgi:hypothetical protein
MQSVAGKRLPSRHGGTAFHASGKPARGLGRAAARALCPRAQTQQQQQNPAQQQQQRALAQQDPFVAAAVRLNRLVENVGWVNAQPLFAARRR